MTDYFGVRTFLVKWYYSVKKNCQNYITDKISKFQHKQQEKNTLQ